MFACAAMRGAAAALALGSFALANAGCSHDAPCRDQDAGMPDFATPEGSASTAAEGGVEIEGGAVASCNATGSWTITELGCACGDCMGIGRTVALLVPSQVAAEGGTFIDSDDSTWSFDPGTCRATLTGDCDASDTIDFTRGAVKCTWTCESMCPPCPATCTLQRQ